MKPYIVLHMAASLDGRIVVDNWGDVKDIDAYEQTGDTLNGDAWMVGRITMELHFAQDGPLTLEQNPAPIDRKDFVASYTGDSFAIAVDASGKLHYRAAYIDKDHIIAVLTEKVSDAYLLYLQRTGISYIFGGKTEIDFKVVMDKLGSLFPIRRLLLEGGGGINGSVWNAGLIDELSLLYFPVVDGTPGTPSLFDIAPALKKGITGELKIIAHELRANNILWIRYQVIHAR